MVRLTIFSLALGLGLAGCSQGVSTLDKRISLIKKNAESITQREGTARGDDLTGIFEVKIWYGQLNCRSTSKYDAIEALENQVQEIPCRQTDGKFECTWIDGSTYKGYIDQDGGFSLSGEFMFEIEEGVTTPAPTTATGTFSPEGKASGSITVAAKGRQENSKATCLLTYSFELNKKEETENEEAEEETEKNSETLTLAFALGEQSGQRIYRDLKTREESGSLLVGAKGGSDERVVARLHPDGRAEVSANLMDRDNRTLTQGDLEGCTYKAKNSDGWLIDCSP